jgi:hypothetical protein
MAAGQSSLNWLVRKMQALPSPRSTCLRTPHPTEPKEKPRWSETSLASTRLGIAEPAGSTDRSARRAQRPVRHVPGQRPVGGLTLGRGGLMIKRALDLLIPRNVAGDTFFCWLAFLKNHGRMPNRSHPIYFSDHLFKLRASGELYDPLRQITSDKILTKAYVEHFLGRGFIPETICIITSDIEVDAFQFSRPCVIKPSHASQLIRVLRDQNDDLDRDELKNWLRFDYYRCGREANYRYIRKRIIVEELLCDSNNALPNDFKLFCFNGEPQLVQVDAGRFVNHTRNFYSTEWVFLPVQFRYPNHPIEPKPDKIQDMIEVARTLARPFSFVRVDLYVIGDRIYVGELTHMPENGRGTFYPRDVDCGLSSLFAGKKLKELNLNWGPRGVVGQSAESRAARPER